MGTVAEANERWGAMLAAWAIPDALVAAAPEPPYFFDPAVFVAAADEALGRTADSPSDAAARAALPAGGTVLDVGAGAGAASLRLPAGSLIGVDASGVLLHELAGRAAARGIAVTTVEGMWPEVASQTPPGDVVVCHHVVYNVADLAGFATALTGHARRRIIVELTAVHPMAWMTPYWEALQDVPQPERPTVDDAVAVLTGLGYAVQRERWTRPVQMIGENRPDGAARIARRLCLAADRVPELERMLRAIPPPVHREVETLWWDVAPG